jgi:hypothetical protein
MSIGAHSKVLMKIPEALDLYFSDHEIRKKTLFLTDGAINLLENESKSNFATKIYTYYEVYKGSRRLNTAIMETHILRSRTQTIFVVFDNKGKISSTEILAFYEPDEYIMSKKWLNQFVGKTLKNKLVPRKDIAHVSGATISYNETTKAIRRTLSLYNYIYN